MAVAEFFAAENQGNVEQTNCRKCLPIALLATGSPMAEAQAASDANQQADQAVATYRKIIVLMDGAGALDPSVRERAATVGRILFEQNQEVITASELAAYVAPAVSALSHQTPAFGNLPGSEGGLYFPAESRNGVSERKFRAIGGRRDQGQRGAGEIARRDSQGTGSECRTEEATGSSRSAVAARSAAGGASRPEAIALPRARPPAARKKRQKMPRQQ